MNNNINTKVASIVKALAYTENGGKPNIKNPVAGKTGETKSIFQFMPDTWKIYSKQTSGQDNLPMTPENEAQVVYHKVGDWLNQGYNTEQIASMWNAGEQRPDAYKQNFKGVNKKYGVAYDTPAYAKKVADYAKQFEVEGSGTKENTPVQGVQVQPNQNSGMISNKPKVMPTSQTNSGLLTPKMKKVKEV